MIRKQFPTAYDVEQTITFRSTSYSSLKRFMHSRGLFTMGRGKQEIADFAMNVLFEHQDYIALRRIAQGGDASTSISGFTLQHRLYEVDTTALVRHIVELRNSIAARREELMRKGAPIPKIDMPALREDGLLSVHFEYERIIPGRVELMQRVDSDVSLLMGRIGPTRWRIVCYPQANQDVKTVQELFREMDGGAYETSTISLEPFSQQNRIRFFDILLKHYTEAEEWDFEQVTEIAIRQPSSRESDDDEMVDEEELEPDRSDLLSITQAILQGSNLRTNSFVRECETNGFYFLSMTLELSNVSTAEVIEVMVRFKLSPQMFEVVLVSMAERDEMGQRSTVFPEDRQREILSGFWNVSHEIWEKIYEESPQIAEGQLSLADAIENTNRQQLVQQDPATAD